VAVRRQCEDLPIHAWHNWRAIGFGRFCFARYCFKRQDKGCECDEAAGESVHAQIRWAPRTAKQAGARRRDDQAGVG
jgi:hypothetical protein